MQKFTLFLLFSLFFHPTLSAQKVIQQWENREGFIQLADSIAIPKIDAGYTLILPDGGAVEGLIVFFHPDRDTISKIFRYANEKGLGVMFVTTENRVEFLFSNESMSELESYIHEVLKDHHIPKSNLFFAGMSLAGTRALRMAMFAQNGSSKFQLKPRAVAICDAPLDMVRFWKECDKAEKLEFNAITANEGAWVTAWLEKNLKGTPDGNREAYRKYSPYCYSAKDGGNANFFKNIALRAYTEPDVQWWMETRRKDYYAMNAVDLAALVNQLKIFGNEEAELIVTHDKGYLPDGRRHPHSWSIVDEKELVDWFLEKI